MSKFKEFDEKLLLTKVTVNHKPNNNNNKAYIKFSRYQS